MTIFDYWLSQNKFEESEQSGEYNFHAIHITKFLLFLFNNGHSSAIYISYFRNVEYFFVCVVNTMWWKCENLFQNFVGKSLSKSVWKCSVEKLMAPLWQQTKSCLIGFGFIFELSQINLGVDENSDEPHVV